jgi:hypothetical protein
MRIKVGPPMRRALYTPKVALGAAFLRFARSRFFRKNTYEMSCTLPSLLLRLFHRRKFRDLRQRKIRWASGWHENTNARVTRLHI